VPAKDRAWTKLLFDLLARLSHFFPLGECQEPWPQQAANIEPRKPIAKAGAIADCRRRLIRSNATEYSPSGNRHCGHLTFTNPIRIFL